MFAGVNYLFLVRLRLILVEERKLKFLVREIVCFVIFEGKYSQQLIHNRSTNVTELLNILGFLGEGPSKTVAVVNGRILIIVYHLQGLS